MNIDKSTLDKLAHLSRLEIDEKDTEQMLNDLSNMLTFVEKLNEVDTSGVEPLTTMSFEVSVLREDEVKNQLNRDNALSSAPDKTDEFFRVPKIIE